MHGDHLTVGMVLRHLLPNGTNDSQSAPDWKECPKWAPDLFAVCATLAKLSGCYAEPGIALSRNKTERKHKRLKARIARREGTRWSADITVSARVSRLWSRVLAEETTLLCCGHGKGLGWKQAAMQLLAIADETCLGVGYEPAKKLAEQTISEYVHEELVNYMQEASFEINLPHSLTDLVPPDICCVLPKAMTPEVGCTLRSCSHSLALLPGLGVVQAEWYVGGSRSREKATSPPDQTKPLNLLLVPFPYVVRASDFEVAREAEKGCDGYFRIRQNWLKSGTVEITISEFAHFIGNLISRGELESNPIHGVIFPEAAFSTQIAIDLARQLLSQHKGLEFVITGAINTDEHATRNEAIVFRMVDGDLLAFHQSKHHRWRLDQGQILQYHLGGSLDPKCNWWENIDVHDRKLQFSVDKHEAVITALVCEDLARHEPVLPVISAVGPSLVVALLMDGPQLKTRWSARYATVLAEDPGSSILTLTCLGMIRRSRPAGASHDAVIGLWKDREGQSKELILPDSCHGLVLCLTSKSVEQRTIDSRTDDGSVIEYRLGATLPVSVKNPPAWLERDV